MNGQWQEIGPAVFRRHYDYLELNVGVVLGGEGLLLVDTRASHVQGRETLEALRALTPLPVLAVVNTHWHFDHCWGNHVFRRFPIWAHETCRDAMVERGEEYFASVMKRIDPKVRSELQEVVITPPTSVFTDSVTLDLGDRPIDLRYFGLAHTDSDITVTVPDADVCFVGDLIEECAPPVFRHAYPMDWPATLRRAVDHMGGVVVPGHGDLADPAFVATQLSELESIAALAAQVHEEGMALAEAVRRGPYPADTMHTALERALMQLQLRTR